VLIKNEKNHTDHPYVVSDAWVLARISYDMKNRGLATKEQGENARLQKHLRTRCKNKARVKLCAGPDTIPTFGTLHPPPHA